MHLQFRSRSTARVKATLAGAGVWLVLVAPCNASEPRHGPFQGAPRADAATLEATRGGCVMPGGLTVSLGIERLVLLNGDVIAHSTLQIADIARLDVAQAQQARAALSSVNLVRNGPDNMNGALMASAIGGTVIQNTLNDQHIDTRTVISSSVNSVGLLTTHNFQGSMSDALARAVLPH